MTAEETMDVDASPSSPSTKSPPLSLPVFHVIRSAQAAHGLRYSDYARYGTFCSKKLRRLSCSLKLNALTQKGKYVKRKVEPEATSEVGHLSLLLTSAERAWSRAQEAKHALEGGPDMAKKRVLLSRSAKAAAWGRELASAAISASKPCCDARTRVEAAAYASWLEGLAAMERAPGAGKRGGDGSSVVDAAASAAAWRKALEALSRAGELCSRLAASSAGFDSAGGDNNGISSPAEARAAARAQAADVAPLVRFCAHQLGRAGAGYSDPDKVSASAAEGAGASWGQKVVEALEVLRAGEGGESDDDDEKPSSTTTATATSSSTFSWRGSSFVVPPSERVRSALASAAAALAEARKAEHSEDDAAVARLAALDRALAAFGDAKGLVRQQAGAVGSGASTSASAASSSATSDAARAAADARSLALAVTGAALDVALERGRLSAGLLSRALDGGEKEAATILKVKQQASATATETTTSSSAPLSEDERKKRQQRRRAAAASKRPPRPEDAVRAYTSLAKTAKQLGEVAAALGGTTGELLLDEAAALGADASARRTYWAARSFLGSTNSSPSDKRCAEAMALLDRAAQRASAAAEAHEECSRPDAAAVASLRSLAEESCPGWKAVAHAEAAARSARGVRAAGAKVARMKVGGSSKRRSEGDDEEEIERKVGPPFLMDRIDEWVSCASAGSVRIAPIPGKLETVPVRPFVLDVAFDGVVPPDISKRVSKKARPASGSKAAEAAGAAAAEESGGTFSKLAGAFGWGSK